MYFQGGAQQISEKMALSLGKDRVLLSTPVQSISEADDRVLVKTKTGAVFKCHKVILAVPPNQLSKFLVCSRQHNAIQRKNKNQNNWCALAQKMCL